MFLISLALPGSFRLRLTILFGGLFLASALLAALSLDHVLSDRIVRDQGEAMYGLASNIAKAIATNVQERHREVILLAQTPAYVRAPLDGDDLRRSLERTKQAYRYYAWIGITNTDGKIMSATGGMLQGQSAAKRPWFIHGQHASFVGDVHQAVLLAKLLPSAAPSGEPLRFVDFASPIYDPSGKLRGVLATHAQWDWVEATIRERLPAKSNQQVFIIDKHGNMLSPFEAIGKDRAPAPLTSRQDFHLGVWPDGKDYLYSEARVSEAGLDWRVVIRQPEQQALAALNRLRTTLIVSGLALTLLLMVAVYKLATLFSQPLEQLADIAERIGQGDEHADWNITGGTQELSLLSQAMRKMTTTLLTRKQELTDINANLELIVAERTEALRETNHQLVSKATQLALQARSDALTGLGNRMAANERLQEEHLRYGRVGAPYSVLLLDADHFKRVNDNFGHDAGDRVLRHIADTVRASARVTDFTARYGGEEFLLLLPETDSKGGAVLAEKIRAAIEQSQAPDVGTITMSIGLATARPGDPQPEAVVKRADQALYQAKAAGRNRVALEAD